MIVVMVVIWCAGVDVILARNAAIKPSALVVVGLSQRVVVASLEGWARTMSVGSRCRIDGTSEYRKR